MTLLLLALWTLDAQAADVLLVTTPGVSLDAYTPWIGALRREGARVTPVAFPCSGDRAQLTAAIQRAARGLEPGYVVAAHGLGATLALDAHQGLQPAGYVLLAPVLDLWPVAMTSALAQLPVGDRVDLSVPLVVEGAVAQEVLLGEAATGALGCVSPSLVREVQGWVRAGAVGLDLEAVDRPVWLAVDLADQVASVEAVVPASRRLADRTLVRMDLGGHLDLLVDPRSLQAATQAVRALGEAR